MSEAISLLVLICYSCLARMHTHHEAKRNKEEPIFLQDKGHLAESQCCARAQRLREVCSNIKDTTCT